MDCDVPIPLRTGRAGATMPVCQTCGKTFLMGGVKDKATEARFCNEACRFKDFFSRFEAVFAGVHAAYPDPMPALAAPSRVEEPVAKDSGASLATDSI